jgi:hypothetical protein
MFYNFLVLLGLLFGALFFSTESFANNWETKEWLKLVRYNKTMFGNWISEADGKPFFLHPDGKKNPKLEYLELLRRFTESTIKADEHPICRFPARARLLLKQNQDLKRPEIKCTDFEKFRERMSAKSIALVFSSYYLNNPASSFGHTFIRLEKENYKDRQVSVTTDLLDTGINYGAVTGNANALFFAVGGFTGVFPGTYNAVPYYYKVREYNDFETRDLWSYHLDFTQEEIDFLVEHIWELGHTMFDYYFLTENCSYHALTMLEAIRPSLNLVKQLPDLYVIPTDTLKVAVDQNIVKAITYRPSASTYFYHHLKNLNKEKKKYIKEIVEGKSVNLNYSDLEKAEIYDTAISFIDYKYAKKILKEDKDAIALKRPILLERSKIPVRSPDLNFSEESKYKPHEGHDSGRFMVGGSNLETKKLLNLDYRFAFHDALDFEKSYLPRTKVEMVRFKGVTDGERFALTDFNLAEFYSLGAWDDYTKSFSWKLKMGQWQTYQYGTEGYSTYGAIGGYGYSWTNTFFTPFLLASLESSYVGEYYEKVKFAYGVDAGFLLNLNDNLKFSSLYEQRFHPWEENFFKNELRISNIKHGMGLFYNAQTKIGFYEFGINYMVYLK